MDTDDFSDQQIFARTIYGEARDQGKKGRQAIANVVMNRANNPSWWGKNVRTVCLKPYQFSCWNKSDKNRSVIMAVTEDDEIFKQCRDLAARATLGQLDDIVNGADHYFNPRAVPYPPSWSVGRLPVAIVGKHIFYRLRK